MYKIDRRGVGWGGSKNRILGQTQNLNITRRQTPYNRLKLNHDLNYFYEKISAPE